MNRPKRIFVHRPEEIPPGEHWVIISGTSVTIPGDERSRTNPGHGYPESTDHYVIYEAYTDKSEFESEMSRRYNNVRGIHVLGTYKAKTTISLEQEY